jgi:hypothetical protein
VAYSISIAKPGLSQPRHKIHDLHTQRVRDDLQGLYGDVGLAALNLAHVRPVQAGFIGKDILGHSPLEPKRPLRRFLLSKEPEVLCISGRWGVGKTYAWKRYLKDAQQKQQIGLDHYSYVSLFGIGSIDAFKYSIFENLVSSREEGAEPSIESRLTDAGAKISNISKKLLTTAQKSSFVQQYVGGLGPMFFFSVKEAIICVDDIERKGDNLAIREILGLVSLLKDQKRCKIVLILNEEALPKSMGDGTSPTTKEQFDTYFEKVIDTHVQFTPSAKEATQIALSSGGETTKLLSMNCIALGIENIRVIKKIERAAGRLAPMLEGFHQEVLIKAVRSLAIFGWCVYEPARSPSLEQLSARSARLFGGKKSKGISDKEAAWNALLDEYGFTEMDEFDTVLLDGIRKGFFDPSAVRRLASEMNARITAFKSNSSFEMAWGAFHDSFESNEKEVIAAIHQAFIKTASFRGLVNLQDTVWILKELGYKSEAAECITRYIEAHRGDRKFFDLETYPSRARITDPDIVSALNGEFACLKSDRTPRDILLALIETRGWNPEDINILCALPADEYYKIFKETSPQDLIAVINACLQFDRLLGVSEREREVSHRAKEALIRIGRESPLNALRVKKFGVDLSASQKSEASEK